MSVRARTIRRGLWAVVLLALVLAVAPFLAPAWHPINCRHEDIDLDTGRARYTRMFYWTPACVVYEHTPISEALEIIDLNAPAGDWRRVNTFSPGVRHSPHHIFHGAFAQAHTLQILWQLQEYSPEARKETAVTVLKLWKQSGEDSGADLYIDDLSQLQLDRVSLSDIKHLGDSARARLPR